MGSLQGQCQEKHCEKKPTHYLVLKVPPVGYSMKNAIKGTVGLALCRDHAEAATPKDVLNAGSGELMERITRALGLVLPDLARAELEVRRIGDDNWNLYQAHCARAAGGGRA